MVCLRASERTVLRVGGERKRRGGGISGTMRECGLSGREGIAQLAGTGLAQARKG
jgi:hypothetical protein